MTTMTMTDEVNHGLQGRQSSSAVASRHQLSSFVAIRRQPSSVVVSRRQLSSAVASRCQPLLAVVGRR